MIRVVFTSMVTVLLATAPVFGQGAKEGLSKIGEGTKQTGKAVGGAVKDACKAIREDVKKNRQAADKNK